MLHGTGFRRSSGGRWALLLAGSLAVLSRGAVAQAPEKGDASANALLAALKAGDFAAATARFDPRMRMAVPQEKLASVWNTQVATFGPLVSWKIVQRAQVQGVDARIVELSFERGELLASIAVAPGTYEIAGFFLKPAPPKAPVPAATYITPSAFWTETVTVGSAPFAVLGTLAAPTGKGPFPAAVLVQGSGPQDRDETLGPNKPFKDIAEGLASRGIAVLRYDKRTFRYGKQLGEGVTIDQEVVDDAVAAVKLLKARPEVDPKRVFVIGHSLGAQLAPEIAARAGPVAGVILLAPPGRAPWDAVLAQMRYLQAPPAELAEIEKSVELLRAGKVEGVKLLGAPGAYWKDWASRDGVATAKKLARPILILRGERDYQVTGEDLAAWKRGLRGVANVEIATLPGDNHLFFKGTGKPGPAEYELAGHVDEAVVAKLTVFILGKK